MKNVEYSVSQQQFASQVDAYADRAFGPIESSPVVDPWAVAQLVSLTTSSLGSHRQVREAIFNNQHLPDIVRNDPPSLRAMLWFVILRNSIVEEANQQNPGLQASTDLLDSPYLLYALTRCWENGMDDVMDSSGLPFKKTKLSENPNQNTITSALANEFYKVYLSDRSQRGQIRDTVRQYRLLRDYWIDALNTHEDPSVKKDFTSALQYNVKTMGAITYVLTKTISADIPLDPNFEDDLNYALVLYSAAGKMIDDMTDWLKDTNRGNLNLFQLALEESNEAEIVKNKTNWLRNPRFKKAFVPISLFKHYAPQATARYLETMDQFIRHLDATQFTELSMSMRGVRQMMWAYALNEGIPQV